MKTYKCFEILEGKGKHAGYFAFYDSLTFGSPRPFQNAMFKNYDDMVKVMDWRLSTANKGNPAPPPQVEAFEYLKKRKKVTIK